MIFASILDRPAPVFVVIVETLHSARLSQPKRSAGEAVYGLTGAVANNRPSNVAARTQYNVRGENDGCLRLEGAK
jgi:hypothetical protein